MLPFLTSKFQMNDIMILVRNPKNGKDTVTTAKYLSGIPRARVLAEDITRRRRKTSRALVRLASDCLHKFPDPMSLV